MIAYIRAIMGPLRWASFPKFRFFLGLLSASTMFPLMQVAVGLMQKFLVNAVEYQNMRYMTYVYLLALILLVMVAAIDPLGHYLLGRSARLFTNNLRERTVEKLLSYPYSFYETHQTGDLVLRLREDLDAIPEIYTESINRLLLGLFYGGGSFAVMMTFSWQLALLVVVLGVGEAAVMARISKKITENNDILQKLSSRQNQMLFDMIKSLSFIKMASLSRFIGGRYQELNEESTKKNVEINKINIVLNAFNDLFAAANLLLVFGLGVVLYFLRWIDLGSVMSFLFLQDGITYMIGNLQQFLGGTRAQIVNCNRVWELLSQEGESENDGDESAPSGDLTVRDLSFHYPSAENFALREISLTIPRGKVTVIYGPSGGGKSTLVKMLLALYPHQSGGIFVGETDYRQIGSRRVRESIAYVPQSPYLFHDTVEANIRCGREDATFTEVMEAAKAAKVHDFILQKADGYQTLVREQGGNFSGGERQRIAIARAILKNAPVVIFDEATSAVDATNEADIYVYAREAAGHGKTVVIVAHRENARSLADREIRIERGMVGIEPAKST